MISLPTPCKHCGKKLMNYGNCNCRDGRLASIERERRAIVLSLARLDEEEAKILSESKD